MFGLGFIEFIVIVVVAVIVLFGSSLIIRVTRKDMHHDRNGTRKTG